MRGAFVVAAIGLCCLPPTAQAQYVKADTGGIAIGRNVSDSTINIDLLPEQVAALIRRTAYLSEAQQKMIVELEGKLDVNQRQIRAALEILGEGKVPPGRLTAKLVEIAGRFKALQTTAAAHPGDDPTMAVLKADAQKAIEAGDLAKADALLANAESEPRWALDRLALNAAEASALRGDVAMARLRYAEAAKHFADAAAMLAPGEADEKKRFGYLTKEADALYRFGGDFSDNRALQLAVARYKRLVILRPRERVPLDWAMTQNNLGTALQSLGERESGTAGLEEAVAAYRAALSEWTRERAPLDWARAQNNLGNVLAILGKRESSTTRLEEAVAAYRAALMERTRARVPVDWALSIGNQGVALMYLAQRNRDGATAKTAVAQIETARDTMWGVAHAPYAEYYEAQLAAARVIAEQILGGLLDADAQGDRARRAP